MKKKLIELTPPFEVSLDNILDAMSSFEEYSGALFSECSKKVIDTFIYGLPDLLFNKYCYATLNPQSYGSKFEEKFRRQYKLEKIASKLEKGDLFNGKLYLEYKMSIMTKAEPVVDIVQIRLEHNIDYYVVQIIDARNPKSCIVYATLLLSKEQMKNECELTGNNSAHGKEGKSGLRIDFKFESETFDRFIKNYQIDNATLTKLLVSAEKLEEEDNGAG